MSSSVNVSPPYSKTDLSRMQQELSGARLTQTGASGYETEMNLRSFPLYCVVSSLNVGF